MCLQRLHLIIIFSASRGGAELMLKILAAESRERGVVRGEQVLLVDRQGVAVAGFEVAAVEVILEGAEIAVKTVN